MFTQFTLSTVYKIFYKFCIFYFVSRTLQFRFLNIVIYMFNVLFQILLLVVLMYSMSVCIFEPVICISYHATPILLNLDSCMLLHCISAFCIFFFKYNSYSYISWIVFILCRSQFSKSFIRSKINKISIIFSIKWFLNFCFIRMKNIFINIHFSS